MTAKMRQGPAPGTLYRIAAGALSIVMLAVLAVASARAAQPASRADLPVVKVRNNFYMIAGDGGNIGVQVGVDGVVLVNAGTEAGTGQLLAAVKQLSPLPIRYIIDTNADAETVGGNAQVAAAGRTLFHAPIGPGASILSYDTVLARMAEAGGQYPDSGWPTEAYVTQRDTLYLNDEPIVIEHEPAAHSDGDSVVLFRRSDVVMAGEVMDMTSFPVIDLAHGGSIDGEIAALNALLEMTIGPTPLIYEYNGTYVVPGHGRVCDQWEVVNYRDMVVIVRDTIADMMKRHMTLAQIEESHPARAYEPRYGSSSGPWTTNMFIEAVYRSLAAKKK